MSQTKILWTAPPALCPLCLLCAGRCARLPLPCGDSGAGQAAQPGEALPPPPPPSSSSILHLVRGTPGRAPCGWVREELGGSGLHLMLPYSTLLKDRVQRRTETNQFLPVKQEKTDGEGRAVKAVLDLLLAIRPAINKPCRIDKVCHNVEGLQTIYSQALGRPQGRGLPDAKKASAARAIAPHTVAYDRECRGHLDPSLPPRGEGRERAAHGSGSSPGRRPSLPSLLILAHRS